jgi:CRP-like cAMP-binding protein
VQTTAHLHAEADAAAREGQFREALAACGEVLRLAPGDHRARVKCGLCLAALGRPRDGATALLLVARALARRGFFLAAIGACRDALGVAPEHPAIREVLEGLHDRFGGLEGAARPRVPPPITPVSAPEGEKDRLHPDSPDMVERVRALAVTDPDVRGGPEEAPPEPIPFFSDLGKQAFLSLVPRIRFHKLPAAARVITQGDPGGSLFVVVSGQVEVTRRADDGSERPLARLTAGHLVGEMSLLTQKPRTASIHTVRPTELFEIDRAALEVVAAKHPAVLEDLVRFARRRMVANLISTSPVFRQLEEPERLEVVRAFETRVARAGEVVIEEGTPPRGLFLVLEGEVEVSKVDASGDRVVLAYLREGDVVGEIALIEDGLTTATVTASERSVLLHLPKSKFEALVQAHPALEAYLQKISAERLVETEEAAAEGSALDADELVTI